MFGRDGHEHHAVLERRVSFDVTVAHGPFVVEREQDESADLVEGWPALGADRFGKGREPAANPVRRENLGPGEHREDLGVDRVDLLAPELHGAGRQAGDRVVLELDQDQDGDMAAVRLRPGADLLQGVDEGGGRRPEIDVGHVEHLQAGLLELTVGVGVGTGFLAQPEQDFSGGRGGEQPSLGIGVHVELDLADALARELLGQRGVGVVERLGPAAAGGRDQLQHGLVGRDVVRVVAADDLNLVQSRLIGPRARAAEPARQRQDPRQNRDIPQTSSISCH